MPTLIERRNLPISTDEIVHPLESAWRFERPMYSGIAAAQTVEKRWLPWAIAASKVGDPSSLSAAFSWLYDAKDGHPVNITPNQVDALYSRCFKQAVPRFLGIAKEAASEGRDRDLAVMLDNAEICGAMVDIKIEDETKEQLLTESYGNSIPRTIVWLSDKDTFAEPADYYLAKGSFESLKQRAKYVGLNIAQDPTVKVIEHRMVFMNPKR